MYIVQWRWDYPLRRRSSWSGIRAFDWCESDFCKCRRDVTAEEEEEVEEREELGGERERGRNIVWRLWLLLGGLRIKLAVEKTRSGAWKIAMEIRKVRVVVKLRAQSIGLPGDLIGRVLNCRSSVRCWFTGFTRGRFYVCFKSAEGLGRAIGEKFSHSGWLLLLVAVKLFCFRCYDIIMLFYFSFVFFIPHY